LTTTHVLVLVNGYDGNEQQVVATARYMQELFRKYAASDGGTLTVYR
jgi:hypothetical protein